MLGLVGITDVLLLITLGVGYLVLYFAKREEKQLQFLGYVVGGVIMALSVVYLLGHIWIEGRLTYPTMRYYKGMHKHMMQPHMMPQTPAQRP